MWNNVFDLKKKKPTLLEKSCLQSVINCGAFGLVAKEFALIFAIKCEHNCEISSFNQK
jgi:hypothetical protein